MRILINAIQAGNRSGTGVYSTQLATWLPRIESEFDYLIVWPNGLPHPHLDQQEHAAFLSRKAGSTRRRLLLDHFQIPRECNRLGINVAHYMANAGCLFTLHNMILTVHDLSFMRYPEWYSKAHAAYLQYATPRSVRKASRIVAVSHATAADLRELIGVPDDRIDVTPNGVDPSFAPVPVEAVDAIRQKFSLPERFILHVGTLEPRKNLVRLIRAYTVAAREYPHSLVLAGREGWKYGPILEAISESALSNRIRLLGHVAPEDLPALYCAAEVFAYPSLFEGFGLPVIEAMACGTPVLTSNTSSLPEVAGDAAFLIAPTDEKAIEEALYRLMGDEQLRKTLSERGLRRAARYSWQLTAALTVESYRKVLAQ